MNKIASPLIPLFTTSILNDIVPTDSKLANTTLIFTKGNRKLEELQAHKSNI